MLTCFFVFDYDSSYYNTLKMKKELFVLVLIFFFITWINLGAQIRGAQTRYTFADFGLSQPLTDLVFFIFSLTGCNDK